MYIYIYIHIYIYIYISEAPKDPQSRASAPIDDNAATNNSSNNG